MPANRRAIWTAALLFLAAFAGYSLFLTVSPVYLAHDEVLFALQAHAIATTAHDTNGRLLPLYVQLLPGYWVQPVLVYLTAFVLKLLPLSQTTIRLPSAAIGAANVALMYLVARAFLKREWAALAAAGMLALTPSHFMFSRLGVDVIYPLPFVLTWLLFLRTYEEWGEPWRLVAAGAALGLGVYSYIASIFMMPLYFALTCVWLVRRGESRRALPFAAGGFVAPLVPFAIWLVANRTAYVDLFRRYQHVNAAPIGLVHTIVDRISLYWDCFNPAFLFAIANDSPVNSTFRSGMFLLPVGVLLAAGLPGVVAAWRARSTSWLLIAGVVLAPLGIVLVGERAVPRLMPLVPFVVLIAAAGAVRLRGNAHALPRLLAAGLLVLVPLQFAYFAHDYFTSYPERSGLRFESNRRDAIPHVMSRVPRGSARPIYVAGDILWVQQYWQFYAIAEHREDLAPRAVFFNPREPWAVPKGAVILTSADRERHDPRASAAGASRVETILDPDGSEAFTIFEK